PPPPEHTLCPRHRYPQSAVSDSPVVRLRHRLAAHIEPCRTANICQAFPTFISARDDMPVRARGVFWKVCFCEACTEMNDKWEPTLDAQREIAIRSDAPLEIVFLPGLLCTEQLWAAQIEGLKDIAHATVARLDNASNMEALASSALNQAPSGAFMLV